LHSICFPASLATLQGSTFSDSTFSDITVDDDNPNFAIVDGFLLNLNTSSLVHFFGSEECLTIESTIEVISAYCFEGCRSLSHVTFESASAVCDIEAFAFSGCSSLLSICIPSSVECLGDGCFARCAKLAIVSFEANSRLRRIGESAFADCPLLTDICLPSTVNELDVGWSWRSAILTIFVESEDSGTTIKNLCERDSRRVFKVALRIATD
jgi:hypothetical protein